MYLSGFLDIFFPALLLFLRLEEVLSAKQCGNLACYVLPGVKNFSVRCKRKIPVALSFDDSSAGDDEDGRSHELRTSSSVPRGSCRPEPNILYEIGENVNEMGVLWDVKLSGVCKQKRIVLSTDRHDFEGKKYLSKVRRNDNKSPISEVCIRTSRSRYLTFDMREGFANQIMSLVYAAHIARRLGFVLVLPKDIDARSTMAKTDLLFESSRRAQLSSLFDIPTLKKRFAAVDIASQLQIPEHPGLRHVRIEVPRRSDYLEYMEKLGDLALSGEFIVVDVGNLFLRLTAASCETQDELASVLGAVTASFNKNIAASADSITNKLSQLQSSEQNGVYNAVHLRIEEDSSAWSVTKEFSGTWEKRLQKAGFSPTEPLYVACGDSCIPNATTYTIYQKSSFPDFLPRVRQPQDVMAAIDYLVLAKSNKFAGSLFSAFSHMVVTAKKAHETYEIYARDAQPFSQGGNELAYGSATPRQPCLGTADEAVIAATDVGHASELITWRRARLDAHGIAPTLLTDVLVALELFQQGKAIHAHRALQNILGYDAAETSLANARTLCEFAKMHPLPGYALRWRLKVECRDERSAKPMKVLFVTHSLQNEAAPLMMQFLIEYLVRVLLVEVNVLAPKDSCNGSLRNALLNSGVRHVSCQNELDPIGYDAIYINTLAAWFGTPHESSSWLGKTIWWVHDGTSRKEVFSRFPKTPKLLPFVHSRIYTSNATREMYDDIERSSDYTIYNSLGAEEKFLRTTMASLRERTRQKVLEASQRETVFILLGTVSSQGRQLEFVRAATEMMRRNPATSCRFVLVGFSGQFQKAENDVLSAVKESNAPDRFMLMKTKGHETALKLLSSADVLVSVGDSESSGTMLLEGMTAGLPLIVQKAGSVPEIAYNAALYVDPRDTGSFAAALQSMLLPGIRAALRANLAQRTTFFNKDVFFTKHVLAFNHVLRKKLFKAV